MSLVPDVWASRSIPEGDTPLHGAGRREWRLAKAASSRHEYPFMFLGHRPFRQHESPKTPLHYRAFLENRAGFRAAELLTACALQAHPVFACPLISGIRGSRCWPLPDDMMPFCLHHIENSARFHGGWSANLIGSSASIIYRAHRIS